MLEPFTKTIESEDYIQTIRGVIHELENISESNNVVYEAKNKAFMTERISTSLRQAATVGTPLERMIKSQFLEAAYSAEKVGPNSTDIFLIYTIELALDTLEKLESGHNVSELRKSIENRYEETKEVCRERMKEPTIEDIKECVLAASRSKRLSEMVLEAVELAGLEGNIIPGGSPNGQYFVELVSGYNFPVSTYPLFTEEDKGRWGRGEVRVMVVDGVVEKASELHKIFTECFENGKPLLLVARGYGEEVIGTIAANKKLDICPIRIPWELESINFITDISVVCGSQIVSTMKGDMVSSVKYEELPVVDRVICTKEKLNILNSATTKSVSDHVSHLTKKLEETSVEEMSDFIAKRIKSLNSHTVHLRLGSRTEPEKLRELESVDYALRIVKGIIDKGTVQINELGFNEKRPTTSVLSAVFHGISLVKNICFVNYAILND